MNQIFERRRREPESPYLRIQLEAEVAGGDTARRAAADEMVADLQDAMADAIDAAAEEVRWLSQLEVEGFGIGGFRLIQIKLIQISACG